MHHEEEAAPTEDASGGWGKKPVGHLLGGLMSPAPEAEVVTPTPSMEAESAEETTQADVNTQASLADLFSSMGSHSPTADWRDASKGGGTPGVGSRSPTMDFSGWSVHDDVDGMSRMAVDGGEKGKVRPVCSFWMPVPCASAVESAAWPVFKGWGAAEEPACNVT